MAGRGAGDPALPDAARTQADRDLNRPAARRQPLVIGAGGLLVAGWVLAHWILLAIACDAALPFECVLEVEVFYWLTLTSPPLLFAVPLTLFGWGPARSAWGRAVQLAAAAATLCGASAFLWTTLRGSPLAAIVTVPLFAMVVAMTVVTAARVVRGQRTTFI